MIATHSRLADATERQMFVCHLEEALVGDKSAGRSFLAQSLAGLTLLFAEKVSDKWLLPLVHIVNHLL